MPLVALLEQFVFTARFEQPSQRRALAADFVGDCDQRGKRGEEYGVLIGRNQPGKRVEFRLQVLDERLPVDLLDRDALQFVDSHVRRVALAQLHGPVELQVLADGAAAAEQGKGAIQAVEPILNCEALLILAVFSLTARLSAGASHLEAEPGGAGDLTFEQTPIMVFLRPIKRDACVFSIRRLTFGEFELENQECAVVGIGQEQSPGQGFASGSTYRNPPLAFPIL